jgi:hypothetical protein|tara:strand:+ start:127 stop:378 length:252 start_codon:yes stop_codon:yes gene_type:complete
MSGKRFTGKNTRVAVDARARVPLWGAGELRHTGRFYSHTEKSFLGMNTPTVLTGMHTKNQKEEKKGSDFPDRQSRSDSKEPSI